MVKKIFPVIDMEATGKNIVRLRKERGLTVRDLQVYFGFEEPQAIYKWQSGKSLPSVDNLYALGTLLEVPMEKILAASRHIIVNKGLQAKACSPLSVLIGSFEYDRSSEKPGAYFAAKPLRICAASSARFLHRSAA